MSVALLAIVLLFAGGEAPEARGKGPPRALADLLADFPHVRAEERGGRTAVVGWTRGEEERRRLDRVLAGFPDVVDLTTTDVADRDRMVEVDVILVVVRDFLRDARGFDFLSLVNVRYDAFLADHDRAGFGFQAPGLLGPVSAAGQAGHLLSASVDYDVNLANAADEQATILARPHLTARNGERAEFQVGGEIVFQVNGIENGDIKPYPFGIQLFVTPTILRTPGPDGRERIRLDVEAMRTSVLGLAFLDQAVANDDVSFEKTRVASSAVLSVGETLVLSGIYERESRRRLQGVPWLRDLPVLGRLFSRETEVDDVTSVVILLTPRDPSYFDERRQREIDAFIERRRAYVRARAEGPEAIARFKKEHPDWYLPRPNRLASQMFLMRTSEIFRQVSGDDLRTEPLEPGLWVTDTAREARRSSWRR